MRCTVRPVVSTSRYADADLGLELDRQAGDAGVSENEAIASAEGVGVVSERVDLGLLPLKNVLCPNPLVRVWQQNIRSDGERPLHSTISRNFEWHP